jgi:hypothetical protein
LMGTMESPKVRAAFPAKNRCGNGPPARPFLA